MGLARTRARCSRPADPIPRRPTETYNPFRSFGEGPDTAFKPLSGSAYPGGTPPDVFFRLDAVDPQVRGAYELAQTPWQTDLLNIQHLAQAAWVQPAGRSGPVSAT